MTRAITTTNADRATAFAIQTGVNIVSDLFGDYFVVHAERDEVYHLAKIDPAAHGGVRWSSKGYRDLETAMREAKERGQGPVTPLMSLPDQAAVNDFCKRHGMKASDDCYNGYVVVSTPIRDQIRKWHVAKRVGNSLKLVDDNVKDRWAARAQAQRLGGTTEPRAVLGGPFMFPFGNNFHGSPLRRQREPDKNNEEAHAS